MSATLTPDPQPSPSQSAPSIVPDESGTVAGLQTITQIERRSREEPSSTSGDMLPSTAPRVRTEQVWKALTRASFAVVSYVTPRVTPRSSGVVYAVADRHLYMAVAPDSWKARLIRDDSEVAVTVPVRRGGMLSLLFPIPPATISFHTRARIHPNGLPADSSAAKQLAPLLPPERRTTACIIELIPEGSFLTYGIGVSLMQMRNPAVSLTRVPVQ
jgi:hypothetical protein